MIKLVAFLMSIYILVAYSVCALYVNEGFSLSVLLGGLAMLVNVAGLAYSWRLIFFKKSIALAVLVIIFKYLLLGMVLWSLASVKWLNPVGFCIGLGALVFAVVVAVIIKSIFKTRF